MGHFRVELGMFLNIAGDRALYAAFVGLRAIRRAFVADL